MSVGRQVESDQAAHTDFDKLPTKVSLGGGD